MEEEKKEAEVAVETASEAEQQQEETTPTQKEPSNWERSREVMAAQKAEIEMLKTHMAHLMQMQQQPAPKEEPDELDSLDPDEPLTVKQAKAIAERQAQKSAKVLVEQYMRTHTLEQDEERVRNKYEDYEYVVKNFAVPLIKNDPALAHKIQTSKNPAETAYRLGKMSDEYVAETTPKESARAQKTLKNASRPVNANAVGASLKTQAAEFANMSKEQIWETSMKYARGTG